MDVREELGERYAACELLRPLARDRHDPGDRLELELLGVVPARRGRAVLEVERFVGGGFAGQVYRTRLLSLEAEEGPLAGLEIGRTYAAKVLLPPSIFSLTFRNFLFFLAYQGPFLAACHPAAVRTGVLWQKLIRRAAARRFGDEAAVCDTFATFFDPELRAFGEVNEWVEGRTWKLEVDDRLFSRWDFDGEPPVDHPSGELVHKRRFMARLVALLHEMGAPELARQYEWWTCKSQPNALKRLGRSESPAAGLTAIDFRAGLALLPFLPMSPADLPLVVRGLRHGRIVQFDRPDPARLAAWLEDNADDLEDLRPAVEELQRTEPIHRASLPDVTHHGLRLLTDPDLRRSVREGTATAWEHEGRVDAAGAARLKRCPVRFLLAWSLSCVPWLGRRLVRLWGHAQARAHACACAKSPSYLWRAMRGARIDALLRWERRGRRSDEALLRLVDRPVRFWAQRLTLGWLPASWHRAALEPRWAWGRIREKVGYLYRFLREPGFREEWLLAEVEAGRAEGMLTDEEAARIEAQVRDPFIQKYLRCLAVHLCTVPITQVVMVVAGVSVGAWVYLSGEGDWDAAMMAGLGAAALIQLMPISPGSISRGLFVVYLMIRERDVRNYYIAAPVSFIHVVGYLAFPLQMVADNAALARFMAGRWATRLTHAVPVFGERGALLEHAVFDLFFNLPLTVKRSFRLRPVRWTAAALAALAVAAVLCFAGVVSVWEWRQPVVRMEAVTVADSVPLQRRVGGPVHWLRAGRLVRLEGRNEIVALPADVGDGEIRRGRVVDLEVRRCFFGEVLDAVSVTHR